MINRIIRKRCLFIVLLNLGIFTCAYSQTNKGKLGISQLPTKTGQVFTVDDWDNKVTSTDLGFNYFAGNSGAIEETDETNGALSEIVVIDVSDQSNGSSGGSLAIQFDFTGQSNDTFVGYFTSLFGLTDTLVSLDDTGLQPQDTTSFPDYFLDTQDLYRGFQPLTNRSVDQLRFDIRLLSDNAVSLKIELQDEYDCGNDKCKVFTRRTISPTDNWETLSFNIPDDFDQFTGGVGNFDWRRVSLLAIVIERQVSTITNPIEGHLLIDNLALVDTDGTYPDLSQIKNVPGNTLNPQFETAFLDWIRATSTLYFLDWASTDARTGGIIQDRSTSADLMTVGGVGFQLSAYVIATERGYISRQDAALRVRNVLQALHDLPQGPARVGTSGYQGFYYHFLGIDGLRKQNFDRSETPEINEALNTVELSTIDTALAIAGVVTVSQYFQQATSIEMDIRTLAEAIYSRVNWPFMLNEDLCQFYLGWKPNENSEGPLFELADDDDLGGYSSRRGSDNTTVLPQTIDFYTDEGLLIALLAMGAPDPKHRVDRCAWDAMIREDNGGSFIKTFPGSLFTYQFASVWLDTAALGIDNHPTKPVNFFANTRDAILNTISYASGNPRNRASLSDLRWGLSAAEGPFDTYFAEAAPPVALQENGQNRLEILQGTGPKLISLQGETGSGGGAIMTRGAANEQKTIQVGDGQTLSLLLQLTGTANYQIAVDYSNDNNNTMPSENISIRVDGSLIGSFIASDTGDSGNGWNIFATEAVGSIILQSGIHNITLAVSGGDGGGVEIDQVTLTSLPVQRALEVGTITNYAVGSSIVHTPTQAIAALWNNAELEDVNQDGVPELLHPRFGFADAFNLDISAAAIPGHIDCSNEDILRCDGGWINFNGFSIDHGPMLIMIDNYLENNFIPKRFMSHPNVNQALKSLFPAFADPVILQDNFEDKTIVLEAEAGTGDGSMMFRGNASGGKTIQLDAGEVRTLSFVLDTTANYQIFIRYSNDNNNLGPLDNLRLAIDGTLIGSFMAMDTGDNGDGWNIFLTTPNVSVPLELGAHNITITVAGGDGGGVEIDQVSLIPLME